VLRYTRHTGNPSAGISAVLKKKKKKGSSWFVRLRAVLGVVLLADSEGHVAVLDHVLNLLSHWRQLV
jgi:hypothetical protein